MQEDTIRFDDGAAYEDFMGRWSQLAGEQFLGWLAPPAGQRWLDVGCGNGAFSEMLVQRCAPAAVQGIDPSEAQLVYARQRPGAAAARFDLGDAMALPYADAAFDAAVMALVIFFVPEPARGVAEMVRVVRPGGRVSAYAWDILGGGFPFAVVQQEMAALGTPPLWPPSVEAARMESLRALWHEAGLRSVETLSITVQRRFSNFDSFWALAQTGPRLSPKLAGLSDAERDLLRARVQARLPAAPDGSVTCTARANAIHGQRPVDGSQA